MFSNLNYIHAQEHIADLMRTADQTRLAQEARELEQSRRPRLIAVRSHGRPVVRALGGSTAHPSREAWDAPIRTGRQPPVSLAGSAGRRVGVSGSSRSTTVRAR